MVTPEGRTKAKLRRVLSKYDGLYTYWPVPTGYGKTTLDVLGCYRGRFFTVETKAKGKKPTLRQAMEMENIQKAMGHTFTIAGEDSPVFETLTTWLDHLTEEVPNEPRVTADPVKRQPI